MAGADLFFDSSALFAGVASPTGAARVLLILSESGAIGVTISQQVLVETERALARKAAHALPHYRQALRLAHIKIVHDPFPADIAPWIGAISHLPDLPILVAAVQAQADFLVTLNRKHFIDDPEVARRAGIRIGTPGDALAWVRGHVIDGG